LRRSWKSGKKGFGKFWWRSRLVHSHGNRTYRNESWVRKGEKKRYGPVEFFWGVFREEHKPGLKRNHRVKKKSFVLWIFIGGKYPSVQ